MSAYRPTLLETGLWTKAWTVRWRGNGGCCKLETAGTGLGCRVFVDHLYPASTPCLMWRWGQGCAHPKPSLNTPLVWALSIVHIEKNKSNCLSHVLTNTPNLFHGMSPATTSTSSYSNQQTTHAAWSGDTHKNTNTTALPDLHSILQTLELTLYPIHNVRIIDQATHTRTPTLLLSRTYIPSCKFWNSLFISSTMSAYALVMSATGLLGSTYLLSITFWMMGAKLVLICA